MESTNDKPIFIVGAGVSGLVAARVLENHGYSPIVIEAGDRAGGRVKTDIVEGYQLDQGFQVMLDAYPKAQEYLNYDKLDLQKLIPGAILFNNGKRKVLGDPTRELSMALPTMLSSVGSFSDKLKVLKLNFKLRKKSLEAVFASEEKTTLQYLKDYGFSEGMINGFFKPFFTGIYLEDRLQTSSRMFEFVFKMFGEGAAVIPRGGIEAISRQLQDRLIQTEFRFNTRVKQVTQDAVTLEDGSVHQSLGTIIATEAGDLVANLNQQQLPWKSVDNLYFEVKGAPVYNKPIIGLFNAKDTLVNNIHYATNIATHSEGRYGLLSVSVVKEHEYSEEKLVERVQEELAKHAKIKNTRFLKRYRIKKALPQLDNLRYEMAPSETQLINGIFLAGDQQLNGSLNAAMMAGERAALGLIQTIEGGVVR
ncbi:NAD(P)/FAD-dependent oxidoreductase [Leeuwenhoekiella parthenopeia]|uniref:FAD-dependent oxidoreductase n=1 Tax=Leeuwenhoekiella parthenopeia TaxID=2890320 RepID=A0ABS8GSN9_9FLAO|nr:NAD(P)/FAD-dependent oxidoreductase [Leeuwenhoekiella parthenopeia]MCC4213000.1 FAD-dependent oxidoreductase [Leeuwenhoekiella parthenopeia]